MVSRAPVYDNVHDLASALSRVVSAYRAALPNMDVEEVRRAVDYAYMAAEEWYMGPPLVILYDELRIPTHPGSLGGLTKALCEIIEQYWDSPETPLPEHVLPAIDIVRHAVGASASGQDLSD